MRIIVPTIALVAALALAGCVPVAPVETATPEPTVASGTPTPEPTVDPVFVAPTTCDEFIGADLAATFSSRTIVLFDSTNGEGIYPDLDLTSVQGGGDPFICLYGQDLVDLSTFQLEVQPASSTDEHEGIIAVLSSSGLAETNAGTTATFTQTGDEMSVGTIIHVVRLGSWLTASAGFGGDIQVDRLTEYLDAIALHLALPE